MTEAIPQTDVQDLLLAELASLRRQVTSLEASLARYKESADSLSRLATFPEQNPNLVIELDLAGRVTYMNPVANERFPELWTAGLAHPLLRDLEPVLAALERGEVDYFTREVDLGTAVFEQKIGYTTEDRQARIRLFAHDLTRRKRAEEALRRSEAQNQALLNALPDLMLQIRRDGTFVGYRAGSQSLYFPPDQFLGRNVYEVLPRCAAQRTFEHVQQALATGETQVFEHKLPQLGGAREFEVRMVVCGDDEALLIVRDITERKLAEQQAIRAERLAMLGLLSAALAHEINNPLQVLQSHLELVLDFPLEGDERDRYREIMRYQIDRLNALTRRVLNFSHPRQVAPEPVSVTRLLRKVLALAARQLQNKGLQVTTYFEPVSPVMAVPDQLDQVFLNLILNASQWAPEQGEMQVSVNQDNDQVVVMVGNSGPPIPPEVLPYIFEALVTTRPEGSGLGLWISRNLVQQCGGSIRAANRADGQGVTFTVRLPAAEAVST